MFLKDEQLLKILGIQEGRDFIKKNRDDNYNFRHPCNLLLVVWQS
jgi:hypothetical protein